ncbi:ATPase family gene 2 protein homolog B isoform X2 [Sinocyclocheilus rhinocerous]|uniref:ATPase family gene 2 protein homolog B isoform X2 n=1 Tax=Sinocyclocheilus rhinocerous TaxID=307959 RepID=UPI0007BA5C57|nr:PREDICTED: spermatogenesis-associated protein 5-like protein 1 isoform X2 [Sinocyclocheilus rhinocerous]
MMHVEGLKVLRRDAVDWDSQRCRMGPALMSGLGLRLGAPVLIRVQRGVCLCTAWPRRDLAEGFLQISTQCATPDLSAQTLTGLTVKPAHITPLTCPRLSSVSVKVFVQRLEHKRKVSEPSVHKLLEGLYVHQGYLVDLSGAETEIRCVLVEKVNSGSQKAGLITARTHVEVSLAQTVKHLERRQEVSAASPGGLEEVYTSLKEMITFPLRYPETLRQLGVSCPRGLLLIGPPGVGKTLLARCMARDIGATLVTVNGPEVTGSRPGESEENLRRVFDQVREAAEEGPCVLLIDEIDSLCPRRTESSGAPENRLVAQLLTLMDGIGNHEGFVIIGATNQPDALDPALRRPGRFDRESIEWPMRFPEAFVRLGVSRPRGVLLYGPPGCAKTTLVKAAASSSHCTFLSLSGAELFSPYVGDSEKTLAQLFAQARACAPSLVFLDEIDSMVGSRADGSSHSVQSQVLSVLLTELDGVGIRTVERRSTGRKTAQLEGGEQEDTRLQQMELQEVCNKDVLIVAATNRPEVLDSALLRPGRLDQIIYVPPPDLEARLAVLCVCTKSVPLHQDVCLQDLAAQTELFSGADLENLCREAALLALREDGLEVPCVRQKYFLKALQSLSPSLSPQQLQQRFHSSLY